ncbi:MAG: glycosyltransferase family 4 protein [Kiritimatiellales bacterium]
MKRLKVLLCAYGCSPFRGSEPGVGWNISTRLGRYHDVTVFYGDPGNDRDVGKFIKENGEISGVEFVFVPHSQWELLWLKFSRITVFSFFYYVGYRLWLYRIYKKAKALHARAPFDLAHHLTIISFREPGFLWKLPIPFFWGPINGADNVPWAYFPMLSLGARARYAVRNIMNLFQRHGSFSVRKAAKKASKIWAVTDEDLMMITQQWGVEAEQMTETGAVLLDSEMKPRHYDSGRPLRLVWSGVLEGRKALPLLLFALAELSDRERVCLTVLGDGPEEERWMALAKKLKVNYLINWVGRVPLDEAQKVMGDADVFIFTSIKEASSTVVMEALSFGLLVICHDTCGMKHVIDESCGIKIPLDNPEMSSAMFSSAIQRILDAPELIEKLSGGALARARLFAWDKKADTIAQAY